MNKKLNISIDEIFTGFIFFEEQLLFLASITENNTRKEDIEELHQKVLYYSNSVSDYLVRTRDVFPDTITIDTDPDLTLKSTLDSLSEFLDAVNELCIDEKDHDLQCMIEDLLGSVNQVLLNTSLEYLN